MQEIYEDIFKIACEELPHKHHVFNNEEFVMYRGFKISLKEGVYSWYDTRYNNYYEPVDPLITKNILISGFLKTLTRVMIHNDDDKMHEIERGLFKIEAQVSYWLNKSSENWRVFKKKETGILSNVRLTQEQIEHKILNLNGKYLQRKNLYAKKRGVLKVEKKQLEAEKAFYLSRIKLYKNKTMGVNSMGAGGSNKTYFNLYQGKLVLEYDKKEDIDKKLERMGQDPEPHGHHKGIEKRQRVKGKNEGKDVFYYVFNDVNGLITNIVLRETDFGEFLNVELTDADEVFVLSLGDVFGRFAKDFIRRVEGLDLKNEVAFGTWTMDTDNGKTYSGVRMYQDGKKIEYKYAIEDLPPPSEKKKGKKVTWDFSEQDEFMYGVLEKYLTANFKPDVNSSSEEPTPEKEKKEETGLPWEAVE